MKQINRRNEWLNTEQSRHAPQTCIRAGDWEPLLYDYAEGLADRESSAAVEAHIRSCAYCRGALEDIRWMNAALRESVPAPKTDLSARVMERIRREEEEYGRVIAETVDTRTGRVLADPTEKKGVRHTVRRISRVIGGIAAVLVLFVGMTYLLPRMQNSGASSSAQDILNEMQTADGGSFSGGVFVGNTQNQTDETEAGGFDAIRGNKDSAVSEAVIKEQDSTRNPVVLCVTGASEDTVLRLLMSLRTPDGAAVSVIETEDGILVSPLSAFDTANALFQAENLSVEISRMTETPDSFAADDAFYIQIREP